MTFDEAQETFRAGRCTISASNYLTSAATYFADNMIGEDTLLAVIVEVTYWLDGAGENG